MIRLQHEDYISTRDNSATIPGMNDALERIRQSKLGTSYGYDTVARIHCVDCSTMWSAHRSVLVSRRFTSEHQRKLTPQQEVDILNHIEKSTTRHLRPIRSIIRNFAYLEAPTLILGLYENVALVLGFQLLVDQATWTDVDRAKLH